MKKQVRTTVLSLGVGMVALAGRATGINPDGILEAASASDLTAAMQAAGTNALVLSEGMLKWTGTGETALSCGYIGNAQSNLAVTVNVANEGATFKIGGKVAMSASTPFVKTGPGTLVFTGTGVAGTQNSFEPADFPWSSGFWKTYAGMKEGPWSPIVTTWDALGWAYGGTTDFTVIEGTVVLNAPGESFTLGTMPWIGNRTQKSQALEVTNHTEATSSGGWFSLSRGTGLSSNSATSTVRISDGSSLTVASLCMGNGNSAGNPYYARSLVEVDGGSSFSADGTIYQPENTGKATITAKNGSVVTGGDRTWNGGWQMRYYAETVIANSSTGRVWNLKVDDYASLTVSNKSVWAMGGVLPEHRTASTTRTAKIHFDDATLMPYLSGVCDWFGNMGVGFTNITVGKGGLTFENDRPAYFGSVPHRTEGPLVKRGAGTLYVPPFTNGLASISVEGGKLGFVSQDTRWTNRVSAAITSASGDAFEVGGEGTLGGRTFRPDGDLDLTFLPRGRVGGSEMGSNWNGVNFGIRHFDGTIQLCEREYDTAGAIWQKTKVNVATNFTATFNSYAVIPNSGRIQGGWLFALQTMDTARCGGNGGNCGYNYGSSSQGLYASGCNSVALGVSYDDATFIVGKGQGTGSSASTHLASSTMAPIVRQQLAASASAPLRCTVKYDATAHTLSLTMLSSATGASKTVTNAVDLATYLGTTSAYVGFTGGTSWKSGYERAEFMFSDFQFNYGDDLVGTEAPLRTGGNVALGAGKTLKATLSGTRETSAVAMDSLQGAGAVTLDLADAGINCEMPKLPPSSANSNDWIYVGNGHYTANGPACAKFATSASGGVRSKRCYPVKGSSWKIAFTWLDGATGTRHVAADYFYINLGRQDNTNSTDPSGLGIRIHMYDVGKSACQFCLSKRGTWQTIAEAGSTTLDKSGTINFWSDKPIAFEIAYDDTAKTLVTTMTQDGRTATATVNDFDANTVFDEEEERLSFYQQVGGEQAKAIIANFSWTGDCIAKVATGGRKTALAFDRISGVTALTKKGSADLAFLKPEGYALPVTLAEGGLRFSKELLQPFTAGVNGGWIFNTASGCYSAPNGVYIGSAVANNADNAQSRRRVRVAGKWRAKWRMTTNGTGAADAMGFFLHNDPRGNQFTGGDHGYCGILQGGSKNFALTWYTYSNADNLNKMGVSTWGGASFSDNVSPVNIRSTTPIDTTVEYDQATKQMVVTLVQGANTYTKTYTTDIVGRVEDDYAYVAFGTGGGGMHTYAHYDNFTFENLDGVDALADARYVGSIEATGKDVSLTLDTPIAGGTFNLAETVKVAAGATLTFRAPAESAVAKMASLELGEGAKVVGSAKVTLAPTAVAGAGKREIAVEGVLFKAPAEMEGGVVRLADGARLGVEGSIFLKAVYVDGVKQRPGTYTSETCSWVADGTITLGCGTLLIIR